MKIVSTDMSFLNISSHPSLAWSKSQRDAAEAFGPIIDIERECLLVDPAAELADVLDQAAAVTAQALTHGPVAAMVSGEPSLCFAIVRRLQRAGVQVFAATTAREVLESTQPDGSTQRRSTFRFVRFRRYPEE